MTLQWMTATTEKPIDTDRVLGLMSLGGAPFIAPTDVPVQHLSSALLEPPGGSFLEAWVVPGSSPFQSGTFEGIVWRRCDDLLFGVITLDEAKCPATPECTPLQAASKQAYASLFRLLDAQGLPHLWRLWNYMADINGQSHGLERYRQFNLGRAQAFEQASRSVVGQVPAACALGLASGPLSIAFLASARSVQPVENPRQVSAFRYPSTYGPHPPTFARAALMRSSGQNIVFVSGTASIVGHQTMHPGDVHAQTSESLDNIVAVLNEAHTWRGAERIALGVLSYRVYLRHAADMPTVCEVLRQRVGAAHFTVVRADICRSDLLVEVEAHGFF